MANWFTRYEQGGGGRLAHGSGRRPILRIDDAAEVQQVEKLVDQHPQTLRPVLAALSEHGKVLSKRTLPRGGRNDF